jgi:hypothetical protein
MQKRQQGWSYNRLRSWMGTGREESRIHPNPSRGQVGGVFKDNKDCLIVDRLALNGLIVDWRLASYV